MSKPTKIKFDPNQLCYDMMQIYVDNKDTLFPSKTKPEGVKSKVVICNEGSSRAGKTWDFFLLLFYICQQSRGANLKIYILRNVLKHNKDFTLQDFKDVLISVGVYDPSCMKAENSSPEYNLFGNSVRFRGLEDEGSSQGYPSDIVFINEALEIDNMSKIKGIYMRCTKLFVMDWNPSFTAHWAFDLEGQNNVFYTHTTFRDNKHCPDSVISELESYSPWIDDEVYVKNNDLWYRGNIITDKNHPPIHKENVAKGTANLYRYKVYNRGIRGAMDGLIFENVVYDEDFPDVGHFYTIDFGYVVDPTVICKYAETETDIYTQPLSYSPMADADTLSAYLEAIKIPKNAVLICDSADKFSDEKGTVNMVSDLKRLGWTNVKKVSKVKTIVYWISFMQKKKIHIVSSSDELNKAARIEQQNYMWKKIDGTSINQPVANYNHFWDSTRYGTMSYNKPVIKISSKWK
jgi:phage terminase large subunit